MTASHRKPPGPAPAAGQAVEAPPPAAGAAGLPDASAEARKLAAAILEVLAGAQTPGDAAQSLGLSLARYYQLETRAVAGLVVACETRRGKGRGRGGGELAALRRECEQLRRECARQQALARATRRTVGLAPPAPAPSAAASTPKRRKRRPTARALKMAALLQPAGDNPTADPGPAAAPPPAVPENASVPSLT